MTVMNVRKPPDMDGGPREARSMMLDHDASYRALCARDARFDGRLYVGVKTTGIFCRPVCPARTPLSKNIIFFASPDDAIEAGFRPCKRCRPLDDPDAPGVLVSKLLNLVEEDPSRRW